MLGAPKPQYQSVENANSATGTTEANHHELKDFDSTGGDSPGDAVSYQTNEDPSIYALLDKRPHIYSKAIDNNSLVAHKETVTPIMHFNPYFEVIVIVVVVMIGWIALLMYYIPNPPVDPFHLSFPVTLGIAIFLGLDIFFQLRITIKNPKFPIQRYIVNCLIHHTASILACCVPLATGETRMYKWMFLLLSVELNTALLKLRRILNRRTTGFRYVNYAFYITWFGIRVIAFPMFCVYVWYIYWTQEYGSTWVAIGCTNVTILTSLYAIWTYNLMNKKARKTKLGNKLAQVAIA